MAWHGKQGKGAMRARREQKRIEAEVRQEAAIRHAHPDGVCTCPEKTAEQKLLEDIFTGA